MALAPAPARVEAHVPSPPAERAPWLLAIALCTLGVLALVGALSGVIGAATTRAPAASPPPAPLAATLTAPGALAPATGQRAHGLGVIVGRPSAAQQSADARRFGASSQAQIATRWIEGFYPIYGVAQETFTVNWLLLASIHLQESAFSTAPGIYKGLNFAHCCGGPMQFNVTNGPPSTWRLVSDSYLYGRRPAAYDHMTATHPSIYDDFDSIMAGAHLLSADGAAYALDGSAWAAAYDYYGHDAGGVSYADEVLARAIGWSQHGFCINCGVEAAMVAAVHAAYGAPVLAALVPPAPAPAHKTGKAGGRAGNGQRRAPSRR